MKRFVSHISNKELDRDLELNYFGARYYQPEFPRFLSPDPVGGTPEVPISWNRYLYCRNDPVNYIDPDGEDPINFEFMGVPMAFDWEYMFYYPAVEQTASDLFQTSTHGSQAIGSGDFDSYAPTIVSGIVTATAIWFATEAFAVVEATVTSGETIEELTES